MQLDIEAAGQDIFCVRDDVIGIDPRHQEQVFLLFKRLHSRDEYADGVGAGLRNVRRLVQRHGGRVWPDAALGAGTTVCFTLPGPPALWAA
jgi:light-regulated signal transduction histidine kinase (bacteriophytochrome)